jgi:starch-binding outer membrane protein, SusD/RagB family
MKTEKIKIVALALFAGLTMISCDSFLDLEPQQSVSEEVVYESSEGVVNALYGAYELLAGPQLYAGTSIFHSDLIGNTNDIIWRGTFVGYRQMNEKAMDPNEITITTKWTTAYNAINVVNNVLQHINIVREDAQSRVEGEARFIRGILYFELVRFYALPYVAGQTNDHPGVPLVLTPTTGAVSDADNVPRATVSDVYDQIILDLTNAKTLLDNIWGPGANAGRATATTSAAFLARVYMAMEQWENAATEADFVLTHHRGYAGLHNNPRNAFNNDEYTSEDVFMIRQNATSNAGQANDGIATFFASLDGLGRGDVNISEAHMARYEAGDRRATVTNDQTIRIIDDVNAMFYYGVGSNEGQLMTSKWGQHDANIPVIRLAEMILTRGEANFRAGTSIGAQPLDDFNAIRNRAGVQPWNNLTLDMIWEERVRELSFEGHRLHDLRRFRRSATPTGGPHAGQEMMWNDPRLVLPIPQREIDVNPNLVQNEGYK